jgi:hypothetical protein
VQQFWVMNAVEVLVPALLVLLVRWMGLEGTAAWLALGAGLPLAAALVVLVNRWEPLLGFAALEWRLTRQAGAGGSGLPRCATGSWLATHRRLKSVITRAARSGTLAAVSLERSHVLHRGADAVRSGP